jgi:hypothetical protein
MPDATSDLTFRPAPEERRPRHDEAWQAVVREELVKLRRQTPRGPRVVPASRPRPLPAEETPRPAA